MGDCLDRSDRWMKARLEAGSAEVRLAREAKAALEKWLEEGDERRRQSWAGRNRMNGKRRRGRKGRAEQGLAGRV